MILILMLFSFNNLQADDVDGLNEKIYSSRLDIQKDACEHGNMEGCLQVAVNYARQNNLNSYMDLIVKYGNMACDGGNANGCNLLGLLYLSDEKIKNIDLSMQYLSKACDYNNTFACGLLGKIYEDGYQHIIPNGTKALLYYEKACNIGEKNQPTCMLAGLKYHDGKIVPRDYNLAIKYYKKDISLNSNAVGSYLNIFEIDLVQNRPFSKELAREFKKEFGKQKSAMIYFDMLHLFRLVSLGENANISKWQKEYKNQKTNYWSFDSINQWIQENKNEKIKANLENLQKIFKEKR